MDKPRPSSKSVFHYFVTSLPHYFVHKGRLEERMRYRAALMIAFVLSCAGFALAASEETPLLAHAPTLSRRQIVFSYGGYLWSVSREGGEGRQLTRGGDDGLPLFWPDVSGS